MSQASQLRVPVPLFATIELRSVTAGGLPGEVSHPMPGAPSLCATVLLMSTRVPEEATLIPDAGPLPVLRSCWIPAATAGSFAVAGLNTNARSLL